MPGWALIRRIGRSFGPGFITGAADDDPSGIATYSQTGAIFGYAQLWVVPFSLPFMIAVQELCGRIGMVTGKGIAGVIKSRYPRSILYASLVLLLAANVMNIGADLGAMAASLQLVTPLPYWLLLGGTTIFIVALQVYVPYPSYARLLKYLTFSLLAYLAVAIFAKQDWGQILRSTIVPHVAFDREYLMNIAALLGTTISPYLFFWQADEEIEEEIMRGDMHDFGEKPHLSADEVTDMRIDTSVGMFFSQLIAFLIIVAVAATLGAVPGTHIESAADAAQALRPVLGNAAFLLFALGIIGTGLLAIPVLAGSVSYGLAEAFGWHEGLGTKPSASPAFYGMIALVTVSGLLVTLTPVGPITLLYWSAIANGVLAPPILAVLYLLGNDRSIMGGFSSGRVGNFFVGAITIVMALVAIALALSFFA